MFLKVSLQEDMWTPSTLPLWVRYVLAFAVASLSIALVSATLLSTKATPTLAEIAAANIESSGVENPVTAVLLNFRSYDTLLEIAVLLIVAAAMLPTTSSVATTTVNSQGQAPHSLNPVLNPVLAGLLRWLVPLALLVSGYLLWTGAYAPGGAFQAGAVVAGSGVAIVLAGHHHFHWAAFKTRALLCIGLLVFVLVAAANSLLTGTTLQYPADYAGAIILFVEVAATISIAAILLFLFCCLLEMAGAQPGGKIS